MEKCMEILFWIVLVHQAAEFLLEYNMMDVLD